MTHAFPWKAQGPTTFGSDYWRLPVSNELVHICTWSLKPWSCSLHSTHDTSVYQAETAEHTRNVSNKATVSKHAKADMPGSLMDAHAKKNKVKKCKILQHVTVIMAAHHHAWISNKRPTESGTLGRRYLNELPIKVCNSTFGSSSWRYPRQSCTRTKPRPCGTLSDTHHRLHTLTKTKASSAEVMTEDVPFY